MSSEREPGSIVQSRLVNNRLVGSLVPAERLDAIDRRIAGWMAAHGILLLRVALGVVFLWFGALKLVPNLSAAETLAGRTIEVLSLGIVRHDVAVPILGLWETLIGVGLIARVWLRVTLLLLFAQMLGTLTPLVLFPAETFARFPIAPTLEGQYIIKNAVLIAGAIVVGATVRGGGLLSESPSRTNPAPSIPRDGTGVLN